MEPKCKGCNRPLVWAQDLTGKWIPLDNTVPIYRVEKILGKGKAVRAEDCYVSHFKTCPKANDFSASKKRQGELGL